MFIFCINIYYFCSCLLVSSHILRLSSYSDLIWLLFLFHLACKSSRLTHLSASLTTSPMLLHCAQFRVMVNGPCQLFCLGLFDGLSPHLTGLWVSRDKKRGVGKSLFLICMKAIFFFYIFSCCPFIYV